MSKSVFPEVHRFTIKHIPIMARLFGKRCRVVECGHWVNFITWRGVVYFYGEGGEKP